MAVLGGRKKRKKKKKIESDSHLVAAFPTRRYDRLQDLRPHRGFLLRPHKAFLQPRGGAKS